MKYDYILKLALEFKTATESKKKKDKKRVDLDVRPDLFPANYDYGEPGLGTGLYRGPMDRFESVTDFLDKSRKERKKKKKKLDVYAKGPSLQQLEKMSGDLINLFDDPKKTEHIDRSCAFCEEGQLEYDANLDLWVCPNCNNEEEDVPHKEGDKVFDIEELDPFTRKRLESNE